MNILIKEGRVLDPASKTDKVMDVFIKDGFIAAMEENIDESQADEVIDASGCMVMPGLVDLNAHFREPGLEHKETIRTGSRAAARGGYTTVCMMPNTKPVIDNVDMLQYVTDKAEEVTDINLYTIAAMTAGQEGEYLTDFEALKDAGAVAVSDNGGTIMNARTARQAMRQAAEVDIPVFAHCEDTNLAARGVMNAGERAKELGLFGIMDAVEDVIVARDILLAKNTGAKLHISHVSNKESAFIIKIAKEQGIPVTAEVAPHHFTLTEDAVNGDDANFKINPPLRKADDVKALKEALASGVIDVIATDHAPHHPTEKERPFDEAPPIRINAILSIEKCAFFKLLMKDSDFPASDVAGNGAKIAKIPMIPMHTPAITGSIKYDMLVPATIPKKKGINNCATEMKNLIPIVAIPVYL